MKDGTTEIVVLLDRSGSMGSAKRDIIGGFNRFVAEQRKLPGEARLTLVQFDSQGPHEVVHDRVPLARVPDLTDATYVPRGMTPLLDAMGWTIDHAGQALAALPEAERPATVVFVVATDGEENASREYSKAALRDKVVMQQDTYSWKFLYLGANQDAFAEAHKYGITVDLAAGNVCSYASTAVYGMRAFADASKTTAHYRTRA